MKTHRCFHPGSFSTGDVITLEEPELHHLLRVRRARPEDRLLLLNGSGGEFEARLVDASSRRPQLEITGTVRLEQSPPGYPALAPCLTPDTDSIIAPAVELGVSAFHPVISDRCTVRGAARKPEALLDRWRRLAVSALKQSERLWLPEFHPPASLGMVVDRLVDSGHRVVCLMERRPDAPGLKARLEEFGATPLAFLIGPEGGWSDEEQALLLRRELPLALLGSGILRAETASLAALASSLAHRC